jgi:hypothetical protein
MTESNHPHQDPGDMSGPDDQRGRRPFWRHAHQDWRVWVGVILMLAGILYYVLSDNFAFRPRRDDIPGISSRFNPWGDFIPPGDPLA